MLSKLADFKDSREYLKSQEPLIKEFSIPSAGPVLSVRDLLALEKSVIIPAVSGIVIYKIGKVMSQRPHYKRQKTDSICAIYLQDLNTPDFITVYMPEGDIGAVFVGLILTLKYFVYSEAISKVLFFFYLNIFVNYF